MPGLGGGPSTCLESHHFHLPWLLGLTPSRAGAEPRPSQGVSLLLPHLSFFQGANGICFSLLFFLLSVYLFTRIHGIFAFSLLSSQLEETHTVSLEAPGTPSCPPPTARETGFSSLPALCIFPHSPLFSIAHDGERGT